MSIFLKIFYFINTLSCMSPYCYVFSWNSVCFWLLCPRKSKSAALKQRYKTESKSEMLLRQSMCVLELVPIILEVFNKLIVYTYELHDRDRYGFLLSLTPNEIIPSGEETLDSFVAIFKKAKRHEDI